MAGSHNWGRSRFAGAAAGSTASATAAIGIKTYAGDNTAMSKSVASTRLSADGLRYSTKAPGSPFTGAGNTRSCFLCGVHRQNSSLKSKRVLGRTEKVCAPDCNSAA
jgi:hypothetical protein